ncbi:hypothetical protein LTR33_001785 [Friedmanniomyces endolithicus]|nr:hypothetical protein LTR33_001785 [Friedmanniomyces endolithicus]
MPRKRGRPVSIESDDPTIVRRREKTLERTRRYHARKRAARDEAIRSSQAQVEQIERVVTLPSIQEDEEAATTLLALAVRRPQGVDLDDDSAGSAPERSYEADEHGMGSPAQLSPIPSPSWCRRLGEDAASRPLHSTSRPDHATGPVVEGFFRRYREKPRTTSHSSRSITSSYSSDPDATEPPLPSNVSPSHQRAVDSPLAPGLALRFASAPASRCTATYTDTMDEGGGPGIEDSALGEEDSEPGNESNAFGHEDHETVDEIDPAGQHDDEPGALADDEESLMSFASERGVTTRWKLRASRQCRSYSSSY